jgi:pyruvate/2-oxoacid:ferredoxin oxidoreductase alpha subunit
VQAESEVAAINMVYGAAAAGRRVMTASSGPGISLKQEAISYMASALLPCVIIDIMRAGPGLGNIWPEQGDYNQVVKGGGHGNYRVPVLAPSCPQEMADLTLLAFELADRYRTPVYVLSDAYTGQMMEPVEFPETVVRSERKPWAVYADKESRPNLITSIKMNPAEMEGINIQLQETYKIIEEKEVLYKEYDVEDAEQIIVAYGICGRLAQSTVRSLREQGLKVGLIRPLTLMPFPKKRLLELAQRTRVMTVIELSNGQMLDDVRLAVKEKCPVEFFNRMGGAVPTSAELRNAISNIHKKYLA